MPKSSRLALFYRLWEVRYYRSCKEHGDNIHSCSNNINEIKYGDSAINVYSGCCLEICNEVATYSLRWCFCRRLFDVTSQV